MSKVLEAPRLADLEELPVQVHPSDEPNVVSVTAWADDGADVTLTWDEIARSASVRWLENGAIRLAMERESVSKISVRNENGRVEYWIWSEADSLVGRLTVAVGAQVVVTDAVLQA